MRADIYSYEPFETWEYIWLERESENLFAKEIILGKTKSVIGEIIQLIINVDIIPLIIFFTKSWFFELVFFI